MSEFLRRLRAANIERDKEVFDNALASWSKSDWSCQFAGEAGELVGAISDKHRGKLVSREDIAEEAADALITLDLLCEAHGIDLMMATYRKFNRDSHKVGSKVELP